MGTGDLTAANIDEDDDGVPLASYYLYDGAAEVPSDVTHVRVAPSVTVIRSDVFGPLGPYLVETSNVGFFLTREESTRRANSEKSYYPKDCVASKNGPSYIVNRSRISSSLRQSKKLAMKHLGLVLSCG